MTHHDVVTDRLGAFTAAGVSLWVDDLSRDLITWGSLAALVRDLQVKGVTTNPTIFATAITDGDAAYDQISDLIVGGIGPVEALRQLTATDIRSDCDILRSVYDATDRIDGRVSIEVDPRLADDTDGTIAEARALWALVDRPNLFIKIPATPHSIPAMATCLAEGISVNATLIFSGSRYRDVSQAFVQGLRAARRAGRDLGPIASVASIFISRVDIEVDRRLELLHTPAAARMRGLAGTANARIAYADYERMLASPQWQELAAVGAHPQRPLGASTSVEDPRYRDTRYVEDLTAPGVVITMPQRTIAAIADHGQMPAEPIQTQYGSSQRVLVGLAAVGVDFDDVARTLEAEAGEIFRASWQQLTGGLVRAMDVGGTAGDGAGHVRN